MSRWTPADGPTSDHQAILDYLSKLDCQLDIQVRQSCAAEPVPNVESYNFVCVSTRRFRLVRILAAILMDLGLRLGQFELETVKLVESDGTDAVGG